ncbi:MAG: RnfABCDGE type electron transport complex subunit G [Kiritimatiellae bacterium]|nr:RnfABCDGE type electron transport complex subunit G [Kiritimatiellia bacterium]
MREIVRLVGVLTVICVVCAALLAAVYGKTREPISQAAEAKRAAAARQVLPAGAPEPRQVVVAGVTNFASIGADGKLVATAVEGRSDKGYGGAIVLMVGISAEGKVIDFDVLEAHETPGLGTKIASDGFRAGIRGREIGANWTVKKDGGEVDAVTAATISSRAALDAIRAAIVSHQAIVAALAGGKAVVAPSAAAQGSAAP